MARRAVTDTDVEAQAAVDRLEEVRLGLLQLALHGPHFGLDLPAAEVRAHVGEVEPHAGTRFLAVVGPSGSGKSSLVRAGLLPRLTSALAAAGRMAFTCYILQTVICTTVFYGHGLCLFGQVERLGQLLIVVGVWVLQLVVAPIYLKRFRFGPLEWLWRSLTYWKIQPMRRQEAQ